MSKTPEKLTEDLLFLAFTRPAMLMGVPLEAAVVNLMLTSVLYLGGGSLIYLLAGPVLHLVFQGICKRDHNQFRVLFMWLDTKGRARNSRRWGGSSVSPLKLVRHFDKKDLDHA